MTPAEVAKVLVKASAYDLRTVGEADVLAWHEVVGRLALEDCLAAVTAHYTETERRVMPSDVRRLAMRIRDERFSRERVAQRREAIEAAAPTRERSVEVNALIAQVVAALPTTESERIHARAVARARAERGRPIPDRARTKPTRKRAADYPPPQSDDIAALATRYLLDGHAPADVAQRLGVSRRWCQRTISRVREGAA